MAFGAALQAAIDADPDHFDRVSILEETEPPLVEATRKVLRAFKQV